MDPLFPGLPEDLSRSTDEELASLVEEHESAKELILNEDEEFLKGLDANEILAQLETGGNQYQLLLAERDAREKAHEAYQEEKASKLKAFEPKVEEEPAEEDDSGDSGDEEEAPVEVVAEAETEEAVEETAEEPVLVTASAEPVETPEVKPPIRFSRTPPPAPSPSRIPDAEPTQGTALVASSQFKADHPDILNPETLARLMRDVSSDLGSVTHDGKLVTRQKVNPWQVDTYADGRKVEHGGGEIVWDGPKTKVARADFSYPSERTLNGSDDVEKIRAALPETVQFLGKPGGHGGEALIASGGLCAPLTPIYTMPNFGSEAEPVWDSLPVFRAERGGVNVPAATSIGDITTAISSISEEEDALGGTFATKSCQDLTCPEYTEVAVNIFAHCREYGNLNARAWPEKIAHENALTMQALSRVSEQFMLDRIKALSINVTQAEVLGAYGDLVHAITKAAAGIRFRLRMPRGARFNLVLPEYIADLLAADVAYTQFDRYQAQAAMIGHLESLGFRVVLYKDDVTGGTSQGFADEAAGALDDFPDDVQYAIYPEGQFIGIDSGVLELGIVRDSVLNSTNDFQVFGERFRNLAMLGPAQGALWVTQAICPSGEFPALGTALSC